MLAKRVLQSLLICHILRHSLCTGISLRLAENTTLEVSRKVPTRGGKPQIPRTPVKTAQKSKNTKDDLSRNISMVLENLLKNYESAQPPNHGKGPIPRSLNIMPLPTRQALQAKDYYQTFYRQSETWSYTHRCEPTVIKTNILIRSMGPVSELDMDYSMDCYFRQYWRDSRLSFHGLNKSLSLSIKMLERIWRPDTYFYNGKHSYVHTITVPNKLLRINQDGDILYSMRLTIKAKCPMELHNFPMDRQSCPLILGSYAYPSRQLVYQWQSGNSVSFESGMALSQFDLLESPQRNITIKRREGEFSLLQVNFNLRRHTGYFLIQVYLPCILIVVLSWVSFWIHREATSDRVGLCITTVLTLSTISLDSRTDLPKVRYATALDWFLLMSFFYCIATLLEFAGVHYFTKVGSGEIPVDEEEWEDIEECVGFGNADPQEIELVQKTGRRRSSLICPIYNDPTLGNSPKRLSFSQGNANKCAKVHTSHITMERQTQTERRVPRWMQLYYCLIGDERYRRERQREASRGAMNKGVNSVSYIDRAARVLFPLSFALLNFAYWLLYYEYQQQFKWKNLPTGL